MKEKRTELLVGLFLLVGLGLLAGLILKFGNFDERFKHTYPITVTFEDGSGLVSGSAVRLGGVKVGRVAEAPKVNTQTYSGAVVELEIFKDFQIPQGSTFKVGAIGFLGDTMVEVTAPDERTGSFIEPGSTVEGLSSTGLGALASSAENLSMKGQAVLEDVRGALKDLGSAIEKLDTSILREENLERFDTAVSELTDALESLNTKVLAEDNTTNLREMLANLKSASTRLDVASEKLGPMLDNGGSAIAELEPGLKRLRSAATGADIAIEKLNNGEGLLAALLQDGELKRDFQFLVSNLRRNGILRYRDDAASRQPDTGSSARRKGFFGRD